MKEERELDGPNLENQKENEKKEEPEMEANEEVGKKVIGERLPERIEVEEFMPIIQEEQEDPKFLDFRGSSSGQSQLPLQVESLEGKSTVFADEESKSSQFQSEQQRATERMQAPSSAPGISLKELSSVFQDQFLLNPIINSLEFTAEFPANPTAEFVANGDQHGPPQPQLQLSFDPSEATISILKQVEEITRDLASQSMESDQVLTPGGSLQKRVRRKANQIHRCFNCPVSSCNKSYG